MDLSAFCDDYREVGIDIAKISEWFLWAALSVAVAVAIAEIIAKLRPQASTALAPDPGTGIVTIIDAIKGLVTALAAAPLWIALFAAGLLVLTIPGVAVPAACIEKPKAEEDATGGNPPQPKPSPSSTATTPAPTGTPR